MGSTAASFRKSPFTLVSFFFQAEDGIRDIGVTGVQTCALPIFMMATCMSTKCLADEAKKVYDRLIEGNIVETRRQLSYIVGRDTSNLSEKEIIRATVETVAENTVDGTISPLFYGILGGAPLAMVYKAVNTMDSMLGYKNEKYINIGRYPAILDDVFNYIPARISLVFFTGASLICGYDWKSC